jgi:hypothetical protein
VTLHAAFTGTSCARRGRHGVRSRPTNFAQQVVEHGLCNIRPVNTAAPNVALGCQAAAAWLADCIAPAKLPLAVILAITTSAAAACSYDNSEPYSTAKEQTTIMPGMIMHKKTAHTSRILLF